ncbi:MAG: outer membrane protein [Verrucomicrobiota bacterium JB025]|nr:outer membrane beta-barrel protein [Verrucomicrobiota bacterium JB025]
MKTTQLIILSGIALTTSAYAGSPEYIAPEPTPLNGLWQWFIGGSAGYLTDSEEAMFGIHAGVEFTSSSSPATHSIFLEVGYTQTSDGYRTESIERIVGSRTETVSLDTDIVPITINYQYQRPFSDSLNYYLGAGLGIALLETDISWHWTQAVAPPDNQGGGSESFKESVFYAHIFAGVSYDITDDIELYGGARYIFMDDYNATLGPDDAPRKHQFGIDGNVLLEIGARYHF